MAQRAGIGGPSRGELKAGNVMIARTVEPNLGAQGPAEIELVAAADAESRALASRLERILAEG